MNWIVILAGSLAALVLVSYLIEAARPAPRPSAELAWAPEIPVRYLDVDGVRLRYVVAGDGPVLVLLHTLFTELDLFQRVIPELAKRFRVYAVDLPGHGWSDIPKVDYSAEYFIGTIGRFLDAAGVTDATLVGESIGGTVGLALAARRHPSVVRVVAVNPYDYYAGRGIRRGSPVSQIFFRLTPVPVLGETILWLRNPFVERKVYEGAVHRPESLPRAFLRELSRAGTRRGHSRAFLSLVRHWASWEAVRREYAKMDRPALLVYSEYDWSREAEREANRRAIPGNRSAVVPGVGHFLAVEAPEEFLRAVTQFADPVTRGLS